MNGILRQRRNCNSNTRSDNGVKTQLYEKKRKRFQLRIHDDSAFWRRVMIYVISKQIDVWTQSRIVTEASKRHEYLVILILIMFLFRKFRKIFHETIQRIYVMHEKLCCQRQQCQHLRNQLHFVIRVCFGRQDQSVLRRPSKEQRFWDGKHTRSKHTRPTEESGSLLEGALMGGGGVWWCGGVWWRVVMCDGVLVVGDKRVGGRDEHRGREGGRQEGGWWDGVGWDGKGGEREVCAGDVMM